MWQEECVNLAFTQESGEYESRKIVSRVILSSVENWNKKCMPITKSRLEKKERFPCPFVMNYRT